MIRMGWVYSNLMANLKATNEKLRRRARAILAEETGLGDEEAAKVFEAAGSDLKIALLMARASLGLVPQARPEADVYIVALGEAAGLAALELAQQLRRSAGGFRVLAGPGTRSIKAQMRAANRAGARWALIIGESELAAGTVVCKDMAASRQESVHREAVPDWLVAASRV